MATGRRRGVSKTQSTRARAKPGQAKPGEAKPDEGGWRFVQPEEILAYRREQGLSRAKLADALGVSTTSIQNWEGGRVAALGTQRRLRSLIDGEPLAPNGLAAVSQEAPQDSLVMMTGQIVSAYLSSQADVDPTQIPDLIRTVKAALRS